MQIQRPQFTISTLMLIVAFCAIGFLALLKSMESQQLSNELDATKQRLMRAEKDIEILRRYAPEPIGILPRPVSRKRAVYNTNPNNNL